MNPTQPAQPPSDRPASPPTPPPAPQTPKMPESSASAAPPPIPPQPHITEPPHQPPKNNIPLIMVAVLFVMLVGGAILAFVLRPQSGGAGTVTPTPIVEPSEVPTEVPIPTVIPTKTPEEKEIDTIDIGTDEAIFQDIRQDINQL